MVGNTVNGGGYDGGAKAGQQPWSYEVAVVVVTVGLLVGEEVDIDNTWRRDQRY